MSWKIRHQGSPKFVQGLTLQQVVDGLLDGHYEPTDEVMGPSDTAWVAIENHPQLEEIAADLEPPPPAEHEDESRIDMNALIDVCLVLLVFFMLTTTYAELQKMIGTPDLAADDGKVPVLRIDQVARLTIPVRVTMERHRPVIRIGQQEVDRDSLVPVLARLQKSSHNTAMLLDYQREVPHGTVVAIEDAARTAHINKVLVVVPKDELTK